MKNLFDVKDKRIVITGGAGVLCSTMAKDLASEGAKVCIADYDEFRANKLAQEIEADGGFALPIRMNVLEKAEVISGFQCALESMGGIDVLINGAGGNKKEATATEELPFFDMPTDAIRWVFDLNFVPSFQAVKTREYIEQIAATLPHSKEITEAVSHARDYVNRHL